MACNGHVETLTPDILRAVTAVLRLALAKRSKVEVTTVQRRKLWIRVAAL